MRFVAGLRCRPTGRTGKLINLVRMQQRGRSCHGAGAATAISNAGNLRRRNCGLPDAGRLGTAAGRLRLGLRGRGKRAIP